MSKFKTEEKNQFFNNSMDAIHIPIKGYKGVNGCYHIQDPILIDYYLVHKTDVIETDNKSYIVAKLKRKEHSCSENESIENKCNQELRETIKNYQFILSSNQWYVHILKTISTELLETLTPLDLFKEKGFYKLIENETEFNEYMSSDVSCNDWCRIKLVKKMKELGLGVGFINAFADLIGNDLERYKIMIELANECKDKDILMYMLTQKFNSEEKIGVGNVRTYK